MRIWVDADACPGPVKEILFRAAARTKTCVTFVANQTVRLPPSPYLQAVRVGAGFDVADEWITRQVAPGDLVVTADIPLAAAVVGKQGFALNPRGELYDSENMGERLMMRNFMEELRNGGMDIGGMPAFSQADRQAFANQLDRFLAKGPARLP